MALPQSSILGPVPSSVSINYLDTGTECTLSKFADDTRGRGTVDFQRLESSPAGRDLGDLAS